MLDNIYPVSAAKGQLNNADTATANIESSFNPSSHAPIAKAVIYLQIYNDHNVQLL